MAVDLDFERQLHAAMQAAPAGSLFETFADKTLRRIDEVLASYDRSVAHRYSDATTPGFFMPPACEQCVWALRELRKHQGRGRAVPLAELAARMRISPRTTKDLVRELRLTHGVLVCSSRDGDGYWIAATEDEVRESMQPYLAQALSELRLYRAMMRHTESIAETLRQIELALGEGGR